MRDWELSFGLKRPMRDLLNIVRDAEGSTAQRGGPICIGFKYEFT